MCHFYRTTRDVTTLKNVTLHFTYCSNDQFKVNIFVIPVAPIGKGRPSVVSSGLYWTMA